MGESLFKKAFKPLVYDIYVGGNGKEVIMIIFKGPFVVVCSQFTITDILHYFYVW